MAKWTARSWLIRRLPTKFHPYLRTLQVRLVRAAGRPLQALPGTSLAFGPPRRLSPTLEGYSQRHSYPFTVLHRAATVHRTPPSGSAGEMHPNFLAEINASLPAGGVASIGGGRVLTSSGAVIGPDDCLIADVSDTFVAADVRANRHLVHLRLPRVIDTPHAVGVLTTYRSDIYYHWLLDTLPRLHLIREAGIEVDKFVAPQGLGFQRDSLARLGVLPDQVIPDVGMHLRARTLVVPTLPGPPGHSPRWASDFLRRSFLPAPHLSEAVSKRIYVSRARSGTRTVSNENEVVEFLERVGFERVFLEDLSFAAQVELFSGAEVVVSPHGSGLANLVFCRPGTQVVELFSPEYVNVIYWLLAEQLDLGHHHLIGRAQPGVSPHRGRVHENIHVNVDELEATLRTRVGIG